MKKNLLLFAQNKQPIRLGRAAVPSPVTSPIPGIAFKDQNYVGPYAWDGLLDRNRDPVTVTFPDGLPECIYYSETPTLCRTPNRKIVAVYAEGAYQQ